MADEGHEVPVGSVDITLYRDDAATALPNPFTRSPRVRAAALTRKAARLIRRMRSEHLIGSAEERTALEAVGAAAPR